MSQSNVEVPPAVPVAAPAAAPVAATPAPAVAPPAAPPPAAAAPAIIPAAPAPVIKTEPAVGDPAWIAERLASDRRARLREYGFESDEEAKSAAAAIKAQKDSQKTLEQRVAERDTEIARLRTESENRLAFDMEQASRMMFGLTDAQKSAVTTLAGDNPTAQLKAIVTLAPTWAKEAEAAAPAVAAIAPAAVAAPPANTAPGRTAPAGTETSPTNHNAVYETLKQSNPFAAAQYAQQNPEAYKTV